MISALSLMQASEGGIVLADVMEMTDLDLEDWFDAGVELVKRQKRAAG